MSQAAKVGQSIRYRCEPQVKTNKQTKSEIRAFPQIFIVQEVLQGSFLSPLGACRFRLLLHTSYYRA